MRMIKTRQSDSIVAYLKPLTGLRFIAALLVIVHHYVIDWQPAALWVSPSHGVLHILKTLIFNVAISGPAGVSFFFILSGFILTYSYLTKQGHRRVSRRDFWVARFARIYPSYLFAFFLAAVPFFRWDHCTSTNGCTPNSPVVTALASVTLIQGWIPYSSTYWNPPGWSLSVEAFFYLLFPFIALLFVRRSRQQLYLALGALWATSLAFPLAYQVFLPDGPRYAVDLLSQSWMRSLFYNPLARLPEFLIGVALARLFVATRNEGTAQHSSGYSGYKVTALAALVGLAGALCVGHKLPFLFLHNGLLDPLFALAIYSLAFNHGRVAAFFSLRAMVLLGEASYGLYILHWPLWQWLSHSVRFVPGIGGPATVGYFVLYLSTAIGVSIVSLYVIEQPARRAIRKLFTRRPATVWAEPAGVETAAAR